MKSMKRRRNGPGTTREVPLPALPLRPRPLSVCWWPWPSPYLPVGAVAFVVAVLAVPPNRPLRVVTCAHVDRNAAGLAGGDGSLAPLSSAHLRRARSR
jgi:hypothetical protein